MPEPVSRVPLVLSAMRVTLHVGFAFLMGIGIIRALSEVGLHGIGWIILTLSVILAGTYVYGTVREKHHSEHIGVDGRLAGLPQRMAMLWLAAVTVQWLCLVSLSEHFTWLAFPLFFLHLHILRTRHAIFAVVVLAGSVGAIQWAHTGQLQPALIVGPLLGAGVAIIMSLVYQALYTESEHQRRAVAELIRTRSELAAAQHAAGQLAERERLAQEIHDTLAQGLSSIVLVSRAARDAQAGGKPEAAGDYIDIIERTASENLAEARTFVRDLAAGQAPRQQRTTRLLERLPQLCADTQERAQAAGQDLTCTFALEGDPVPVSAATEAALVRSVQSLLSNVAAHAHASAARVTLAFFDDIVTIDVFDNGRGFDPGRVLQADPADRAGADSGYGLRLLRERLDQAGGEVTVESAPGQGTVVGVSLPLTPVEDRPPQPLEGTV